jgi:N-alpha-acetyltransferase 15/16, NatA auxiliary subunit
VLLKWQSLKILFWLFVVLNFKYETSASKAIEILEAYEGTLEDDYPPENERIEHGEMILYKVFPLANFYYCFLLIA